MSRVRARGEDIRRYILEQIEKNPGQIASLTAQKFAITRQAANKHLQKLTAEGALVESGNTRAKSYKLAPLSQWTGYYPIQPGVEEHRIWDEVKPRLGSLPDNVMGIWQTGFTEMFNNALEHSEGGMVTVSIEKTAIKCEMMIMDNGVGIFHKIQRALGLDDPKHSVLELAKGKFTTDPKNHSGQGIFFTSRMFDNFSIHSRRIFYSHEFGEWAEYISDSASMKDKGTCVVMELHNHTARTARAVYDEFSSMEQGFFKTLVPVRLAQDGNDQLVSRSQAKRLLTRIEKFHVVVLNFKDVPEIGQGFADEVFRVFRHQHPEVMVIPTQTNEAVKRMIGHVLGSEDNVRPPENPAPIASDLPVASDQQGQLPLADD